MIKYAKIINEKIGLVDVAMGSNIEAYKAQGMIQMDIQQSDIDFKWYIAEKCPMKTEEEKQAEERKRLNALSVRRGDVFEALILSRQIVKSQIRAMIEQYVTDPLERELMLNRFDEAVDYYREYPLFDLLGNVLEPQITSEMWDKYFDNATKEETKAEAWKYLTTVEFTIVAVPETANIIINGTKTNKLVIPYGSDIEYLVSAEGYVSQEGKVSNVIKNTAIDVVLEEIIIEEDVNNSSNEEAKNTEETTELPE